MYLYYILVQQRSSYMIPFFGKPQRIQAYDLDIVTLQRGSWGPAHSRLVMALLFTQDQQLKKTFRN